MSRNKVIISKGYIDKNIIVKQIEEFGRKNNYTISKEKEIIGNLYDIYISLPDTFQLEIWVIPENQFKEDVFKTNGNDYYIAIYINHYKDNLSYFNQFVKYFLSLYPDMLVADEPCKDFYSLEQIKNKKVPEWLLA